MDELDGINAVGVLCSAARANQKQLKKCCLFTVYAIQMLLILQTQINKRIYTNYHRRFAASRGETILQLKMREDKRNRRHDNTATAVKHFDKSA